MNKNSFWVVIAVHFATGYLVLILEMIFFAKNIIFGVYMITECKPISAQDEPEEHVLGNATGYTPPWFTKMTFSM